MKMFPEADISLGIADDFGCQKIGSFFLSGKLRIFVKQTEKPFSVPVFACERLESRSELEFP